VTLDLQIGRIWPEHLAHRSSLHRAVVGRTLGRGAADPSQIDPNRTES
jgi:hypothetical protein